VTPGTPRRRAALAVLLFVAVALASFGCFAVNFPAPEMPGRVIEPRRTPGPKQSLRPQRRTPPGRPTATSTSTSCEYPDQNPKLYVPWQPIDSYLRLTAKNTESLGTYIPSDLEDLGSSYSIRSGEPGMLRREAAASFRKMVAAAAADGVTIRLVSGYRSCWTQRVVFQNHVLTMGLEQAQRFSARPGQSEHQLGLAADIGGPSTGYSLTQSFGDTAEGTWLRHNAWNFGFVLSYPNGKEKTTGYAYEPWHWRFIGDWKLAKAFNESGKTLYAWLLEKGN